MQPKPEGMEATSGGCGGTVGPSRSFLGCGLRSGSALETAEGLQYNYELSSCLREGISVLGRMAWSRIGVEAAAVVGSILLAFSIQAWWDGRADLELRRATLEGLLADFEAAEPYATALLGAHRGVLSGNAALVARLRAGGGAPSVRVADTLLLAALGNPTYNPPRASVELALATGRLVELEDEPIRRLLAQWLQNLDDTAEDELYATQVVEARIVPMLSSVEGIDEVLPHGPAWTFGRLPDTVARSSHVVTRSDLLIGLLAVRMSHTQRAITGMIGLVDLQQIMVDSLSSLLGRH